MSTIAKFEDFPDRRFRGCYWELEGEKEAWVYISAERLPWLLAVDLLLDSDPKLQPIISRMRAGQHPFRNAREAKGGKISRFLVAELAA